jgi:hypothetical protein
MRNDHDKYPVTAESLKLKVERETQSAEGFEPSAFSFQLPLI